MQDTSTDRKTQRKTRIRRILSLLVFSLALGWYVTGNANIEPLTVMVGAIVPLLIE